MGIQCANSYPGKILEPPLQIRGCVLQLEQLVGVCTADLWIQQTLPRVHKMLGYELHAVAPEDAFLEVEAI